MFQGVFQGLTSEQSEQQVPVDGDDTEPEDFDLLECCSTGDASETPAVVPASEGTRTPVPAGNNPQPMLATNEVLLEVLQELRQISCLIAKALPHLRARP